MKIGLDLDGVVYPWHEEIYRYFQENRGYSKDICEFWLKDRELITDFHVSIPFLYLSTTPRQDILTYVPKLAKEAELFYITARHPDLWGVTQKFFEIYRLPFRENLIFDHHKENHIRLNRIDIFVDDLPKNIDRMRGITKAYLFRAVHNLQEREGYETIGSMRELYQIITGEKRDED